MGGRADAAVFCDGAGRWQSVVVADAADGCEVEGLNLFVLGECQPIDASVKVLGTVCELSQNGHAAAELQFAPIAGHSGIVGGWRQDVIEDDSGNWQRLRPCFGGDERK